MMRAAWTSPKQFIQLLELTPVHAVLQSAKPIGAIAVERLM